MNDLASLIEFLLTAGLLASPIALLMWLARDSDSLAGGPFGMRFDGASPPVREEVDPPRWRVELIGEGTARRPGALSPRPRPQRRSAERLRRAGRPSPPPPGTRGALSGS